MDKRLHFATVDTTHNEPTYLGTWEQNQDLTFTKGLAATPEQRLEWLEEAMQLAHATGALLRRRLQRRA
jgi:hypothetical protein